MGSQHVHYTNIFDAYASRNLDHFRRFLSTTRKAGGGAGGAGSSQGGGMGGAGVANPANPHSRSPPAPSRNNGPSIASSAQVNQRDMKGRTLLHLLASAPHEDAAMEWVQALLGHSATQINATDLESGWTALHRALYAGNLSMARLLIDEAGADSNIKDHEGLTPFDLWNSTIEGTNPTDRASDASARTELFTWGTNRNLVLGTTSDGDRALPERVASPTTSRCTRGPRAFRPALAVNVVMARLHTSVITHEGLVGTCGFGSGGRLGHGGGRTAPAQFLLAEVKGIDQPVASVALGQDHTVVVTKRGDVFTFGMNRFGQLGYDPNAGPSGKPPSSSGPANAEEALQTTPRRVIALRKEVVLGAAASRWHTAVFTDDSLLTWGANYGQLGYGGLSGSLQLTPRRVTAQAAAAPLKQLAATDYATACLTINNEVFVLCHDAVLRVGFPVDRFPSTIQVYRPKRAESRQKTVHIAAGGDTFAAVSNLGDVFSWTTDKPSNAGQELGHDARAGLAAPKPQRIWSLRKKFTAVTDAAVGMDGSIIVSTRSGHCFVRSPRLETSTGVKGAELRGPGAASGKKAYKFFRIPYLQRVIQVAANPTGAFAAIRRDAPLNPIVISGPTLPESLAAVLPHVRRYGGLLPVLLGDDSLGDDDDDDDTPPKAGVRDSLERDFQAASALWSIAQSWDEGWADAEAGSDIHIMAEGKCVPVHQLVLAARSPTLAEVLRRQQGMHGIEFSPAQAGSPATASLGNQSHFAILLLLHYIYTDDLPALWDMRVLSRLRDAFPDASLAVDRLKAELSALAEALQLPQLGQTLELASKRSPAPTLNAHFEAQLSGLLHGDQPSWPTDTVLQLADRDIPCHSLVLRARCTFFSMLYEDEAWTVSRLADEEASSGNVRIDMKHLRSNVIEIALRHIYTDDGVQLFEDISTSTADEFIDLVVAVLAAADELLLDKLKEICSAVLREFVTLHNVVSILAEADFYRANSLRSTCMDYITCSLETIMESHLLQDVPADLLRTVSTFAKERQRHQNPTCRSGALVTELLTEHADYLGDLDLARPNVEAEVRVAVPLPPSSPLDPAEAAPPPEPEAALSGPSSALPAVLDDEDPFVMDDLEDALPLAVSEKTPTPGPSLPSTPAKASPWAIVTPVKPGPASLQVSPSPVREAKPSQGAATTRPVPQQARRQFPSDAAEGASGSSPTKHTNWRPLTPPTWRAAEAARVSLTAIQTEQASAASHEASPRKPVSSGAQSEPRRPAPSPRSRSPSNIVRPAQPPASLPKATKVPTDPASAIGAAIITPSRAPAPSSSRVRSAGSIQDSPWANYASTSSSSLLHVTPAQEADSTSPSSVSFATIQWQQQTEGLAIRHKLGEKLSFAQIQAEEDQRAQDRKQEEEFLKWFEEEQKRLAAAEATSHHPVGTSARGGRGRPGGKSDARRSKKGVRGGASCEQAFVDGNRPAPPPDSTRKQHSQATVTATAGSRADPADAANGSTSGGGRPKAQGGHSAPTPARIRRVPSPTPPSTTPALPLGTEKR